MRLAAGIRKHGFRKWYERELLQGHACMALTFVCMVGVLAAVEAAFRFQGWADQLIDIAAVALLGGAGLWALRRYLRLLTHAEHVAHQATCPSCGTYARLQLQSDRHDDTAGVRCRQCGHAWTIDG